MQALPMDIGFCVAVGHDHDRGRIVTEFLQRFQIRWGLGDIDGLVLDAALIQPTLRRLTRLASWGRVNSDVFQGAVLPIGITRDVRCW